MNQMQNKIAGQTKILELRDDPVAAAHSSRYQSHITRLSRFSENVQRVQGNSRVVEGYMEEALSILHRVRELAVTGATDTFTTQEKQYMGEEINQLMREFLALTNAQSGDGTTLFSGDNTFSQAFRASFGNVTGSKQEVITSVEYIGTIKENLAEISEGSFIATNYPGNKVFWAEQQTIISSVNAGEYQVSEDTAIRIDGKEVSLNTGDTIHSVISKINDSGAAVRAKLDPIQNSLVLITTNPHQLWLEDVGEGTVLQDVGILSQTGSLPPNNIAPDASMSGGSVFDMMIHLRDALFRGDTIEIGGSGIQGIDTAMDNLLTAMATLGARDKRLQVVGERLAFEIPKMIQRNSVEVDLDMAEAITNLKMLEYTHKAALQTAGRILQPTLLDFMR
jgi:flagellar hook-associated protein 3 FlgL